jgi:hypothetical protein
MAKIKHLSIGCLLALGTGAFAQTVRPDIAPPATAAGPNQLAQQSLLAQQFVDEKLAVWRQRLKLENWKISAVMTPLSDLAPKTLGGIRWDKPKKSAVIFVLNPADYRLPFREMLDDMELTIVHELVHLELATASHHEASRSVEEHAVNGIAEALLALDRAQR